MSRPEKHLDPITVYPLPPTLPTNPYLDQLYNLEALHAVVVRRISPRQAIPELLLGHGRRILHVHFFDELTQRPSRWQSIIRSGLFAALLLLLKLRGVRIVWTAHNLKPHENYHPDVAYVMYRWMIRLADRAIAHSFAARDALRARYGDLPPHQVIPIGNYIGTYGPLQPQVAARAQLNLPPDGPIWLCVGALRPYKNIEGLLDAFAQLDPHQRGTLLIAGDAKVTAYRDSLREQAASIPGCIVQAQFVPDELLPLYFAAASVVVLPYRAMLTSAVLLCALSYARAVVAPAFGPVSELVQEGVHGFLFSPNDPASLQDALTRALAHPDLDGLGAAGYALAETFDWATIALKTQALYCELWEQAR